MKNESEAAFPLEFTDEQGGEWDGQQIIQLGMTMRDYFAGQALNGLLSDMGPERVSITIPEYVKDAYRYADAMLKEREK